MHMEISLFNKNIPMCYLPPKFAEAHSCKLLRFLPGGKRVQQLFYLELLSFYLDNFRHVDLSA